MQTEDPTKLFARMLHQSKNLKPGDLVVPPIVPASIYWLPGEPTAAHQYGRWSNPTWTALEEALSVLEDAETVILPSGMAAISALLYSQLKSGERVLLPSDGYYTTRAFAEKFLRSFGVEIATCPTVEYEKYPFDGLKLVWIETPSNPGLDVCDLRSVVARAHEAGALAVVDNTTSTPLGQRPLDIGADAVIASDTKTISGHSDNLLGHVASRNGQLMAALKDWRKLSGAIPGPFEAWLCHRGLETLEVRYERMCATAMMLAGRLSTCAQVEAVRYPGLPNHPRHAIAKGQMLRFGSLIGVTFNDKAAAERFITESKFIRPTTSFGGVHTSAERRGRWGDQVHEGFVRLSVGCEPAEVLWTDMKSAIDRL